MQVHAFQARDGELAEDADEIRKRAGRRFGELMREAQKAKGAREPGTKQGRAGGWM